MVRIVAVAVALAVPMGMTPDRASADTASTRPLDCSAGASRDRTLNLTPSSQGPLTLSAIHCQASLSAWTPGQRQVVVSPDGRSIVHVDHHRVRVARLDSADAAVDYPIHLGAFETFAASRSQPAFRWSSNSRSLWGVVQAFEPDGFRHAITPMRPARVEGGELEALAELRHAAGSLDGLFWAGDGVAVVQFGSRGSAYKEPHDDPSPTFAIVDARRGLVLDTLPFAAIEGLVQNQGSPGYTAYRVESAEATIMPDGRVRAVVAAARSWVVWTQSEPPRILPDPYFGSTAMALSPDGSRLLVARNLHVDETCNRSLEDCRYGPPVEGALATLHDVATGQALWTYRTTAHRNYRYPAPAISPDGRHALIALARTDDSPPDIGLVSLDTGALVQTIPAPGEAYDMGFARGGQIVWSHSRGVTALYELN